MKLVIKNKLIPDIDKEAVKRVRALLLTGHVEIQGGYQPAKKDHHDLHRYPQYRPNREEVIADCRQKGLTQGDGEWIYDRWELAEWYRTKHVPIKNWRLVITTFKREGWFPSQKRNGFAVPEAQQKLNPHYFR